MVYFLSGKKLGDEDAYGRAFDGEYRPLIKEAFNAMIQASTQLVQKPRSIELSDVDATGLANAARGYPEGT